MSFALGLAALAGLPFSSIATASGPGQSATYASVEQADSVAKALAMARAHNMKLLVYGELDDRRPDGHSIVRVDIIAQQPGSSQLLAPNGPELTGIRAEIAKEAEASGKEGWRRIVILVDHGAATVRRDPWAGAIEYANDRLHAEVDRAFPGHS